MVIPERRSIMHIVLRSRRYASFLFSIGCALSFRRTLMRCGLANSVLTDERIVLSPYSIRDSSPALNTKQTVGLSK